MIYNDQELKATQERIKYFCNLLAQLRVTVKPEEFSAVASGYRTELASMQNEVLEYLTCLASEQRWSDAFAASQDELSKLADKALSESNRGETRPLDELL